MSAKFATVALLIISTGCDSKPTPSASGNPSRADAVTALPKLKTNPQAKFQGRTAASWGEQAHDRDYETRLEALTALDALGADGVPYLVDVIQKASPGYIDAALRVASQPSVASYADDLIPSLRKMLGTKIGAPQACNICKTLGKYASPLLPELENAKSSDNKYQNQWAKEAIAKIKAK